MLSVSSYHFPAMQHEPGEVPRRDLRLPSQAGVILRRYGSVRHIAAELQDLSENGCRVSTSEPLKPGEQILVRIQGLISFPAVVIWSSQKAAGAEFSEPLHYTVVEHYARVFGPSSAL